jgi:hypothetical protein
MALLRAEIDRRQAVAFGAADGDPRQQLFDELQTMAQRFAASAAQHPLDLTDMSPMVQLAANLLPEHLRPVGLPSEARIWARYRARSKDR